MRALNGILIALLFAGTITGCQSMSRLTGLGSPAKTTQPVARSDKDGHPPERIVTLEPDVEKTDSGSGWKNFGTKLLNPFAKPKKRMPLPQSLAEAEDESASPGFH